MKKALRRIAATAFFIFVFSAIAWIAGPWALRSSGDMTDPRSEVHAAQMDGIIYVAGGIGFFRTLDSCAAFDSAAGEFAPCPDLPRHLHHVAMAAGEGLVFASGGYDSLPFTIDSDGALFVMNPDDAEPLWQEIAPLPRPRGQHAMVYRGGGLYLIGGDYGSKATGALTRYDLASGKWSQLAPMPTPRHSHAIALSDDTLYVTGGRSAVLGGQSRVIEAYDFASDSWTRLPDAPFDLGGHGAAIHDGILHVYGGEDLPEGVVLQSHSALDLSDPAKGWQMRPLMALPRHGFATARIGNNAWIIGGGKRAGIRTPYSVTANAFALPLE